MRHMSLTPIITNIDEMLTRQEKERLDLGNAEFFEKNRILHNICSKRDRNGLKLLWKEAMKGIPVTTGESE